jgi:UDP-glucose 4-epimerase
LSSLSNGEIAACCEGKRLLITGGGGYLAYGLVNRLKGVRCSIIRLGRSADKFTPFPGRARISDVVGDVRERQVWNTVLDETDVVFHFAAQTSVYIANQDPVADFNSNVLPMLHLLEACRSKRLNPIVVFAGTATEVGTARTIPVNETFPDRPVTIYDMHKLMAENYLKYYTREETVRGTTLRLANVYGPGPASSSADRGVLNMMLRRALAGEPITVYGEGNQIRDYIYLDDVTNAFLNGVAAIENTKGRNFVIGSGEGHTILEAMTMVSERVALKTGVRSRVIHIEPPQPQSLIEARNFVADSSLFCKLTGWRTRMTLAEGIDRTIESVA